ncbi:MAG: nuclear transport factor 2 family protein [Bacteroidota bacterium]
MPVIQEKINALFIASDQRNWAEVEQCFSPNVLLDYSSMSGQPAAELTPAQIVESWKTILPGFDATHHQLGNFRTRKQTAVASAFCYGTATHFLDNEKGSSWTVIGTYDFELEKDGADWTISKMTFHFRGQSGNLELPALAMSRVSAR